MVATQAADFFASTSFVSLSAVLCCLDSFDLCISGWFWQDNLKLLLREDLQINEPDVFRAVLRWSDAQVKAAKLSSIEGLFWLVYALGFSPVPQIASNC